MVFYPDNQYIVTMTAKIVSCAAAGLIWCLAASAAAENAMPYAGIIERNVFGLKPAPPPPDPELSKPPPPKITLTGITDILGKKLALMETPPPPAKAGETAKSKQSYMLSVGQRKDDIEVLDIDFASRSVKVNNGGQEFTLTLEKDGPKTGSGGGGPAPLPGAAPTGFGAPGGPSGFAPAAASGPAHFPMPVRPTRTSPGMASAGSAYQPAASGFGAPVGAGGFGAGAPLAMNGVGGNAPLGYGNAGAGAQQALAQQQQQPALTPEQQILMMEAEREANKNNPNFPPLPPTPMNPNPTGTGAVPGQGATVPPMPGLPQLPRPPGYGAGPPMPQ